MQTLSSQYWHRLRRVEDKASQGGLHREAGEQEDPMAPVQWTREVEHSSFCVLRSFETQLWYRLEESKSVMEC